MAQAQKGAHVLGRSGHDDRIGWHLRKRRLIASVAGELGRVDGDLTRQGRMQLVDETRRQISAHLR